jgi:hypothetical protein
MFSMMFGQPVEAEGFLDVLLHPVAKLRILRRPFFQPRREVGAGLRDVLEMPRLRRPFLQNL